MIALNRESVAFRGSDRSPELMIVICFVVALLISYALISSVSPMSDVDLCVSSTNYDVDRCKMELMK